MGYTTHCKKMGLGMPSTLGYYGKKFIAARMGGWVWLKDSAQNGCYAGEIRASELLL